MTSDIGRRKKRWKKKGKILTLNLSEDIYRKLEEISRREKKSITKILIEILREKFKR